VGKQTCGIRAGGLSVRQHASCRKEDPGSGKAQHRAEKGAFQGRRIIQLLQAQAVYSRYAVDISSHLWCIPTNDKSLFKHAGRFVPVKLGSIDHLYLHNTLGESEKYLLFVTEYTPGTFMCWR
jgi:hypothetical protein